MDLSVIPECFVDTNLTESITPPIGKGYNHQMGCGTVAKKMKEKLADQFALGIIDKDKKQLDYLSEFTEEINHGSLVLYKHKKRHHYIIQISPAIEKFIIDSAGAAGVLLEDYDLPAAFEDFKRVCKTLQSKNDHRFKALFKEIKNAGSPNFETLSAWIKYLRDTNYQANIQELKRLCFT